MTASSIRRLVLPVAAFAAVAMGMSLWLEGFVLPPDPGDNAIPLPEAITTAVLVAVGSFVVRRQPRNGVGLSFLAAGAVAGVMALASGYAEYGLAFNPDLPGIGWVG